jgi:hypothetical protein
MNYIIQVSIKTIWVLILLFLLGCNEKQKKCNTIKNKIIEFDSIASRLSTEQLLKIRYWTIIKRDNDVIWFGYHFNNFNREYFYYKKDCNYKDIRTNLFFSENDNINSNDSATINEHNKLFYINEIFSLLDTDQIYWYEEEEEIFIIKEGHSSIVLPTNRKK